MTAEQIHALRQFIATIKATDDLIEVRNRLAHLTSEPLPDGTEADTEANP